MNIYSIPEQKVFAEINNHQIQQFPTTELMICLTSQGGVEIDRREGEPDRVDLSQTMEATLAAGTAITLWHNHPKNHSISGSDWRLSLHFESRAAIAVLNRHGSLFRGHVIQSSASRRLIPGVGTKSLEYIRNGGEDCLFGTPNPFPAISDEAVLVDYIRGKATHLISHLLNQELCRRGIVAYDACLSKYDASILAFLEKWRFLQTVLRCISIDIERIIC